MRETETWGPMAPETPKDVLRRSRYWGRVLRHPDTPPWLRERARWVLAGATRADDEASAAALALTEPAE